MPDISIDNGIDGYSWSHLSSYYLWHSYCLLHLIVLVILRLHLFPLHSTASIILSPFIFLRNNYHFFTIFPHMFSFSFLLFSLFVLSFFRGWALSFAETDQYGEEDSFYMFFCLYNRSCLRHFFISFYFSLSHLLISFFFFFFNSLILFFFFNSLTL